MIALVAFLTIMGLLIVVGAIGTLIGSAKRNDDLRGTSTWLIIWSVAAIALLLPGLLTEVGAA